MLRAALIRMVYMGVMFMAGLVLSNLALPERFGSISLLILNASLLSLITGFGADSIILYKVSNGQWKIAQAFRFAWQIIFLQLAIFLTLELGALFFFRATFLSEQDFSYFSIDAIYYAGFIIAEKYLALFYALFKSKTVNIALAVTACGYLLLLALFYYFIEVDFVYVLYAFAFQSLLQALVLVLLFGFDHSRNSELNGKDFISAVKISSVVMITNVIQLIAYRVDFWLLKYFYGSYEVGLYAQANKFANLSWIVPNILAQLLLPQLPSLSNKQKSDIFSVGFYSNFLVLLLTIICTQFLYDFYLQPEYGAGLKSFYLMMPGYFFWASVIYFGAFISASGKFSYNLLASSCCFLLIAVADILLIPKFGIEGAAVANTLVYSTVFLLYLFLLKSKFFFQFSDLLWPAKNAFSNVVKLVSK